MPKRRRNPVPKSSALRAGKSEMLAAARLYEDFSGHPVKSYKKVPIPGFLNDLLKGKDVPLTEVGKIDFIGYSTRRDGRHEKYIHKFKASARPIFAVSHDGKFLVLLGGSFTFTERGIVDKT